MIAFSTCNDVEDNRPKTDYRDDWPAFADWLESQAQTKGVDKLTTLCVSPAIYNDGVKRRRHHVLGWTWFAADIDNKGATAPGSSIAHIQAMCVGLQHLIYTTPSHTPASERFRLMMPLSRAVTLEEFSTFWLAMAQIFDCMDVRTKDPSRLFIVPRDWGSHTRLIRCDEGEALDVDAVLAGYVPPPPPPPPPVAQQRAVIEGWNLKTIDAADISLDGPFVTPAALSKAMSGHEGGRMFSFLLSVGVVALLKDYDLTVADLESFGHQLAAMLGRHTNDIRHDAKNAFSKAQTIALNEKAKRLANLNPYKKEW